MRRMTVPCISGVARVPPLDSRGVRGVAWRAVCGGFTARRRDFDQIIVYSQAALKRIRRNDDVFLQDGAPFHFVTRFMRESGTNGFG